MYTKEDLIKYPYFEKILQTQDVAGIVDSLTGLISRKYMIGFIHSLINENIPFTVSLLDLDNFKFINDTQGHKVGDAVLNIFGNDISKYMKGFGLVGRYGGDEFILINLRDTDYASVKKFYVGMYENYDVMRRNITVAKECEPFVTGTLGSASFPKDATNYETLFALIDKTLYRGKLKGRNCYIIYVEEKHKDIQIKELARRGVSVICNDLAVKFDTSDNLHGKLENMLGMLCDDMRISHLFYIDRDYKIKRFGSNEVLGDATGIDKLVPNNIYSPNNIGDFRYQSEGLYKYCKENEVTMILLVKISIKDEVYGYLMCAQPNSERIWQDDEEAILFFTARMMAGYMQLTGEEL